MPIDVTLILADAATVDPLQKVHMLGAGWGITITPTPQFAVVVMLKIPWDRANERVSLTLGLFDSDGAQVNNTQGDPIGIKPTKIEVGRPPGLARGTEITFASQLTVPSLDLKPGRYVWRCEAAESSTTAAFQVVDPRTEN